MNTILTWRTLLSLALLAPEKRQLVCRELLGVKKELSISDVETALERAGTHPALGTTIQVGKVIPNEKEAPVDRRSTVTENPFTR